MKKSIIALILMVAFLSAGCGTNNSGTSAVNSAGNTSAAAAESIPETTPESIPEAAINTLNIARHPSAANFGRGTLTALPSYDENSTNNWQIDLRGYNLSGLSVEDRYKDLIHADFDSKTKWPAKLPKDYDPEKIMEIGKNPGFDLRKLHSQEINGKGVSIAIIDQALLVDHEEYKDNLKMYEEIHWPTQSSEAQMHGPAVASIAVGRTVGVAPGADLYYIAEQHGDFANNTFNWDFTWLAKSIDRILEVNNTLPADNKIRVISISVGWSKEQKGYQEVTDAVQRAKEQGIFVVSSSLLDTFGFAFNGLGREPYADPDNKESYTAGIFWSSRLSSSQASAENTLLVPMDSRTTASPTGVNDYVFYRNGGWSWSIPYIAGLYALSCQVNPEITPEKFWDAALKTGDMLTVEKDGNKYEIGKAVNPEKLMDEVGKK